MSLKLKLSALAVCAAAAVMSIDASACSTVIVGKDVSKTGEILIAHNEDNGGTQYCVVRMRPPLSSLWAK